jgi:hypothetical protein
MSTYIFAWCSLVRIIIRGYHFQFQIVLVVICVSYIIIFIVCLPLIIVTPIYPSYPIQHYSILCSLSYPIYPVSFLPVISSPHRTRNIFAPFSRINSLSLVITPINGTPSPSPCHTTLIHLILMTQARQYPLFASQTLLDGD